MIENLQKIFDLQQKCVEGWHAKENYDIKSEDQLLSIIERQHSFNFQLWHQEDIAHKTDVSDTIIAQTKGKINILNQQRNTFIGKMDDFIVQMLCADDIDLDRFYVYNSETPGSIIDKISILASKIFHMREQTLRDDVDEKYIHTCKRKLETLKKQREHLNKNLLDLFKDIYAGERGFKIYRQFKMYNY